MISTNNIESNLCHKHHRTSSIVALEVMELYQNDLDAMQDDENTPNRIVLLEDINEENNLNALIKEINLLKNSIDTEKNKKYEKNKEISNKLIKIFNESKQTHFKKNSKEKIFLPVLSQKKTSKPPSHSPSTSRKRPSSNIPKSTKKTHSSSLHLRNSDKKKSKNAVNANVLSAMQALKNFHS